MKSLAVKRSLKPDAAALIVAVVGAVLIPWAIHVFGILTGAGNDLGTILLPMHLSAMVVGLVAGPMIGLFSGIMGPILSYLLCGMPAESMIFAFCFEIGAYGLICGLLRDLKFSAVWKVMIAQMAGRTLKAFVLWCCGSVLSVGAGVQNVLHATLLGLPGIILQIILVPLTISVFSRLTKYYE